MFLVEGASSPWIVSFNLSIGNENTTKKESMDLPSGVNFQRYGSVPNTTFSLSYVTYRELCAYLFDAMSCMWLLERTTDVIYVRSGVCYRAAKAGDAKAWISLDQRWRWTMHYFTKVLASP